jgi:thiol-disulfide isomerase/thioredoxin
MTAHFSGLRLSLIVAVLVAGSTAMRAQPSAPSPLLGRTIGTFAWESLDDSTNIVSPLSLRGSIVLIDLWGTWCAPCRRELPFMHAAYAKFHAAGFDILSIAFDVSSGKVRQFRREQFPMPWQHVYATAAIEEAATKIFQLDGFPRAVLIDRDGVVIRVDDGLRGPALAATLDTLLTMQSHVRTLKP